VGLIGAALAAVMAASVAGQSATPERPVLCASVDQPRAEAARALESLGDAGRAALVKLAGSSAAADATCGVSGLAALRDRSVVSALVAALANSAFRDDAYRFARWAAYVAGGPEADLGAAFLPLVKALEDPAVWRAAGDDAIRLLGEIDHPAARSRLVAELARPQTDATIDALIHALARQGEPRVDARIVALGQEAVGSRSGNLTYEQARRLGAVSLYLLVAEPSARTAGLEMLHQMTTPGDQADIAAWAAQTWCEHTMRRPAERAAAERARASLAAEFDRMNIRWSQLARGSFRCGSPMA
jgi:hypothetical protein